MRCPTVFGSHLKEEFFVTHSKNVFLNNLFKTHVLLFFSVKKPSAKLTEEVKKTGPGFSPGPDELWISQVKSSNRFAVNRLRGLRSGSKTQIAEYSQF